MSHPANISEGCPTICISQTHEGPKGDPFVVFVTLSEHMSRVPSGWCYPKHTKSQKVALWFLRCTHRTYLKGARRLGYLNHTKGPKVTLWCLRYTQLTHLRNAGRISLSETQKGLKGDPLVSSSHPANIPGGCQTIGLFLAHQKPKGDPLVSSPHPAGKSQGCQATLLSLARERPKRDLSVSSMHPANIS